MSKYDKIAVIYGSDSSESEVSCRSGEFTASRIDQNVYDVYEIYARFGKWSLVAMRKKNSMRVTFPEESRPEINKTDFSVNVLGEKVKFDYVYIMQHGAPGENGQIQGYFEMLGIPFSGCSSAVCAVSFDKYICKSLVKGLDCVNCAPDVFIRKGADVKKVCEKVAGTLKLPVFVKPTQGGSSFGVTRVSNAGELESAVNFAFSEGSTVLVEQGVKGREVTCAAFFDGKQVKALPLVEIITENEYFDYDAKYNGHSSEVCPAEMDSATTERIQKATCEVYRHLGCSGVVRVDYVLCEDGLYFLEVNNVPGMTSASLVPKMVAAAGMDITSFLSTIIENS